MAICYLSLGSNLEKRKEKIKATLERLENSNSVQLLKISSFYETLPVGPGKQPKYLNIAIKIKTDLMPLELLRYIKDVEVKLGRRKRVRWGPREIDIDILFYDNKVIESRTLTIPHPLLHKRVFVLEPLAEIEPGLKHPVLNKTIKKLLDENNKKDS